jgi:hypothetical protein
VQLDEFVFANHQQEAIMATTFEKVSDGISHRLQDAGERIVDFKDDAACDLGKRVDALGAMMKSIPCYRSGSDSQLVTFWPGSSIADERARSALAFRQFARRSDRLP